MKGVNMDLKHPQLDKMNENIGNTKEKIKELQAKLRKLETDRKKLEDRILLEMLGQYRIKVGLEGFADFVNNFNRNTAWPPPNHVPATGEKEENDDTD
jgi:pyruvate-formate lyase-activating enzyme